MSCSLECPPFIRHPESAASVALRRLFISNLASKYSLSMMANMGPHARVCRHMCQQTLCQFGVHGYLLEAVTRRRTMPNQSFERVLLPRAVTHGTRWASKCQHPSLQQLRTPNLEAQRLPVATLPFLKGTLTQNPCSELCKHFMQGWRPRPAGTRETQLHAPSSFPHANFRSRVTSPPSP